MKFNLFRTITFLCFFSATIHGSAFSQTIALTDPTGAVNFMVGEKVRLAAEVSNPSYLHVTNIQTGYRKLKIGYSPVNLYNPKVNVAAGGNNRMEITLCNFGGDIDWDKIQVRPQGNTSDPVILAPYVTAAGGIGNSWKTISIPLSAFNSTIDFSGISLLELPYSAGAGNFDIGISKIAFTGGISPFVWFGPEHDQNLQNGNGGSGELVAALITPSEIQAPVERVDFYEGGKWIASSVNAPYSADWTASNTGIFLLSASVVFSDGTTLGSAAVEVLVISKPVSPLNVKLVNPVSGSQFVYPEVIPIAALPGGFSEPDPAWIQVSNVLTGYRKLKIGYSPTSLYTPMQNVTDGGNNTLEITMKDIAGNTNWSKIQIRPQGSTAQPVCLAPYIAAAGGLGPEWKTISIPLSAFDPSINFAGLSLIELPYSQSAGILDLGFREIRFTGGTSPFIWFGGDKTDNLQNGNGGPGELTASVIPSSPGAVGVDHVDFFADDLLIFTDREAPYEYAWTDASVGDHYLTVKLTDDNGLTCHSDAVAVKVADAAPDRFIVTVTFDAPPSTLAVEKSALRYNKAFAYSFTLDDGLIDAYTFAYPLLSGGLIAADRTTSPGLFYSDGCGNAIPFSAGLSWYTASTAGNDLHVNTPSYMTWTQLSTLYQAGWNVFNHSFSHAAYGTTDYDYQITHNTEYVKAKTGIEMSHFVIPSGDQGYVLPAFENNMLSVNANNGAYRGSPSGYRINQQIDFSNFRLYKMLLSDANQNTDNIMQKINAAAALSVNGDHYWWSDFTHHVGFQASGASLLFPLFRFYMESVAQQYGISGADNVWMAPTQDVYEYLAARDNCVVNYALSGNILTITVDYSAVPANLRTNALTLNVLSDRDFNSVSVDEAGKFSYHGAGSAKLINLEWGSRTKGSNVASSDLPGLPEDDRTNEVSVWPNPFTNRLSVNMKLPVEGETRFELIDLTGKSVFSSTIYATKGKSLFDLDLNGAGLIPGLYFLKIRNGQNTIPAIKVVRN